MKNAKQHLFYTLLVVFGVTAALTILGVTGALPIRDAYLGPLMGAFLLESAAALLAVVRRADFFPASPEHTTHEQSPTRSSLASASDYRGPSIHGEWLSFPGDSNTANAPSDGTVTIEQSGHQITMRLKLIRTSSQSPVNRIYIYRGELDHGHLVLTWHQEGGAGHNCGAVVLQLSGDLNRLTGKAIYFGHEESRVVAEDFYLQRV